MLSVGYTREDYPERRIIIDKSPFVLYKKERVEGRIPEILTKDECYYSENINTNRISLLHFFNSINFGKTPFITSFETIVPRYWNKKSFLIGAKVISRDICKKIIAISKNAYDIERKWILECDITQSIKETILQKMTVLHPPQPLISNDISRFENIKQLRCIFIGNDFFRKGGVQLLRVLTKLKMRMPIQLIIISCLSTGYNVTEATNEDIMSIEQYIKKNSDWITLYKHVRNDRVLSIASTCHVGFLPTFSDTYGFSVLEMQAAGVPVITTSIRALPEINNSECGWLINHPPMDHYANMAPREKLAFSRIVELSLEETFNSILDDLSILIKKSKSATTRIKQYHDPLRYGIALQQIYENAAH